MVGGGEQEVILSDDDGESACEYLDENDLNDMFTSVDGHSTQARAPPPRATLRRRASPPRGLGRWRLAAASAAGASPWAPPLSPRRCRLAAAAPAPRPVVPSPSECPSERAAGQRAAPHVLASSSRLVLSRARAPTNLSHVWALTDFATAACVAPAARRLRPHGAAPLSGGAGMCREPLLASITAFVTAISMLKGNLRNASKRA